MVHLLTCPSHPDHLWVGGLAAGPWGSDTGENSSPSLFPDFSGYLSEEGPAVEILGEGELIKKGPKSQMWWHMPLIPAPGRQKQVDLHEFEVSRVHKTGFVTSRVL